MREERPALRRIYITWGIDMIDALTALGHNQFETARYYPEEARPEFYRTFRFEQVSEREKQYSQPIQNLIAAGGSIVIRTAWKIGFEVQKHVELRGKHYVIESVTCQDMDINPQVRGLLKYNPNRQYVLALSEVDL